MAWKGVTLENIDTINPIDGSDFIDKATLKGSTFQFVVKKGQFNVGDEVLYAEIDTLLPQWVLQELGLEGKLSGKDRNRVKTVSLRKTLSQGLVMPVEILGKVNAQKTDDLNEVLGVEKYEAPVIPCNTGLLMPLPDGLSKYDIEGTERYQDILDIMRPLEVEITEKLEGCLDASTIVNTIEYGDLPISEIVDNKLDCHVLTYNTETNDVEMQKVLNHSVEDNNGKEWFEIELEDGRTIKLTGNHRVWLPELNCYRRVDELEGDEHFLLYKEDEKERVDKLRFHPI